MSSPPPPREEEPSRLEVLGVPISPCDGMYHDSIEHYRSVGASALHCLQNALAIAERPAPERILDFPCGHGRVLRHLRHAWPRAQLMAGDLDRDGVDFCARELGARPIYSSADLTHVELGGTADLIWCGSLLTHLDQPRWLDVYRLLLGALERGGLLAFSVHGRWVAQRMRAGASSYLLSPDGLRQVLAGYERERFGYADYPQASGYGVSVCHPGWLLTNLGEQPDIRIVSFSERAWDGHQDVLVCQRAV